MHFRMPFSTIKVSDILTVDDNYNYKLLIMFNKTQKN
jgi:hypothetical protein